MTLYVYGASDDLIEIEGLIVEEFNPPYGKPARLVVAVDGSTVASLRIEYDPDNSGEWRIDAEGAGDVDISRARGEDEGEDEHGCPGYSDLAIVHVGADNSHVEVRLEDAA